MSNQTNKPIEQKAIVKLESLVQKGSAIFSLHAIIKEKKRELEAAFFSVKERLNSAKATKASLEPKVQDTPKVEPPLTPSPSPSTPSPSPLINPTTTATPSYVRGVYKPPPAPVITRSTQISQTRPKFNASQKPPFNKDRPPRPQGTWQSTTSTQGARPPLRPGTPPPPSAAAKGQKPFSTPKKDFRPSGGGDDKRGLNKRTLVRKGFSARFGDDERGTVRKLRNKKQKTTQQIQHIKIEKATITTENLTVKILSEKIGIPTKEILKKLMLLGVMTTINSVVDFPTMELVANEFGVELELKLEKSQEEILAAGHDEKDDEKDLVKRPPIITVMGHVDHGKTSLLDKIRKASVAAHEAGGITQHIGAYSVKVGKETITFLDTPGHEAFTHMRARGAQVTDIAILVVAADDGIMPQTIEAINHAKSAKVEIIVAINKIDKAGADVEKVRTMLGEYGLVPEEWGGDQIMVPISAKLGEGIDKLLESILLVAEVQNYRANPNRLARASVIEAKIDKGRGPIANVIVTNGTLKRGDTVVCGTTTAKVRFMIDDKGKNIKSAAPGSPVSILGFTEVPSAGDMVLAVESEKTAKQVAVERIAKRKTEKTNLVNKITLDDVLKKTATVKLKDLNLIIKGDVQGSVEALKESLEKLQNEEAKVHIVHSGVGNVNKTDVMLAEVSKAKIIAFNVKADSESKIIADSLGLEILLYKVIYEAIENTEKLLKGMLTPKYKEVITGRAEVRLVYKITGTGQVAGSFITNGKIYRNSKARIFRGEELIFEGSIRGLKRFKEDVKDVAEGYECGISIDGFSAIKEGDIVEAYQLELLPN